MNYKNTPYFKVGRATDLSGRDRAIYRMLEIMPGFLSWFTLLLIVFLSIFAPIAAAYFIIAFDVYWLLKTIYLSIHLRHNWKRLKHNMQTDWQKLVSNLKHEHIVHLIILPFYNEGAEVVESCLEALVETTYDKKKFAVVLAGEERMGTSATALSKEMKAKYGDRFGHFLTTMHPKDKKGELAGKGSNSAYAIEEARRLILDKNNIPYELSRLDLNEEALPVEQIDWLIICGGGMNVDEEHLYPWLKQFQPLLFQT